MRRSMLILTAVLLAASLPALAEVTIEVSESEGDVIFSGSGTLNVGDLTSKGGGNLPAGIDFGREVLLGADPTGFPAVRFLGDTLEVSPPDMFGTDNFSSANFGTGPRFGIAVAAFANQDGPTIVVPEDYVSGELLESTSTYSGHTISSLGLIPGTYTWSWGSGNNADSLTLIIVADADGDGVPDDEDAFPNDPEETTDTDGDGIGNNADTDDDGDTMPDEYEIANSLDPLDAADADGDADGDGFTNLEEFQAGTDPQNADDAPAINKVPIAIIILLDDDES